MYKLLLTLALAAITLTSAQAQVTGQFGTIQFVNNVATRFTINGVRPLNTSMGGPPAGAFNIGVFAGLTAYTISDVPAGPLGASRDIGGLFTAPNPQIYELAGFGEGSTAFLQFRMWESGFGMDWETAKAEGYYGETEVRAIVLGSTFGPGAVVWSASRPSLFQAINVVPEPSTVVLVGFGLGSLLLVGRRRGNRIIIMNKLLLTLALAAIAFTGAQAQGTIQFNNTAGSLFTINGVRPLNTALGGPAPGTFYVGVFAGATADAVSHVPAGPLGTNTFTGGIFRPPNGNAYPIPGFGSGETVFIMFRMWESALGTDWHAGKAGGYYGETGILPFVLGPDGYGPGTVVWNSTDPTKFQAINLVPEPSTVVLVGFGLGSLFPVGRRRGNSNY
jgi:hypothetical protein